MLHVTAKFQTEYIANGNIYIQPMMASVCATALKMWVGLRWRDTYIQCVVYWQLHFMLVSHENIPYCICVTILTNTIS